MSENLTVELAHVLWIGGATDAGKTSIAQQLGQKYELQVYNYDRYDVAQHYYLAHQSPEYRRMWNASLDESWVQPEPEELVRRSIQSFQDRFPLVIEDLRSLPSARPILAEGFGFTPELILPLLGDFHQAVWLIPTADFKHASMQRRNKPSWGNQVSDPARATHNLFTRDMLLTEIIRESVLSNGLTLYEVDGSRSIEDMTALVESHFAPHLS